MVENRSTDPVLDLFENLYFAPNSIVAKRHLKAFLSQENCHRDWVLRVLIDGSLRVKLNKQRLKLLLFERIEPWQWERSVDFIGDTSETLSRLWPLKSETTNVENPANWPQIEEQLALADKSAVEIVFSDLLDRMEDGMRWLLVNLYVKRTKWGLSRQDVFRVIEDVCLDNIEVEAFWYYLKGRKDLLEGLLRREISVPKVERGADFSGMQVPVFLKPEAITKLDPEEYEWTCCKHGEWVQCCATTIETNLYRGDGELLNLGFSDLLHLIQSPGRQTVVVSHQETQTPIELEKRLLAAKQGRPYKKTASADLLELILLEGDRLFEPKGDPGNFRVNQAKWKTVNSWQMLESIPEQALLRRKRDSEEAGPKWIRIQAAAKKIRVACLYAEKSRSNRGYASLTVGLQNAKAEWLPLTKIDPQSIGILDLDRFEDWANASIVSKRGPIVEFEKELVMEISYSGVSKAPRRKCGLNLENVELAGIVWDAKPEALMKVESFVGKCE